MSKAAQDKRTNGGPQAGSNFGEYGVPAMIVLCILGVLAILVFSRVINRNTRTASLKIPISKDRSITMDLENDTRPIDEVLKKIFGDENAKRDFQNLLVGYEEYSPRYSRIIQALQKLSLYDEVPRALKELALKHQPPFNGHLRRVQISFPQKPGFPDSEAVVCDGSSLFQHAIYLENEAQSTHVVLKATRTRPCVINEENIQITIAQGRQLFGERPLNKFEPGWAGINP